MSEKQIPLIFSEQPVPAGFDGYGLETLPNDPEVIIRNNGDFGLEPADLIERTKQFENTLSVLKNYGFNMPNPSFVLGPDYTEPGSPPSMYTICERVHGSVLEQQDFFDPNIYASTVRNLISYYDDVVTNGGTFLTDLDVRQFMYGTTKSDNEPKTYLVDLDMNMHSFDASIDNDTIAEMYADMNGLARNLVTLWSKYGQYDEDGVTTLRSIIERLPRFPYEQPERFDPDNAHLASDTLDTLEATYALSKGVL